MKSIAKKFIGASVIALTALSANAVIINNDDVVTGTFLDTDTGLTWLDLRLTGSASFGSYNYRYTRTISDNLSYYSDFRVATKSDVSTLISNAFSSLTFGSDGSYHYKDEWRKSEGGASSAYDPNFHDDYNNLRTVAGGTNYSSRYGYYYDSRSSGGHSALFGYFLDDNGLFDSLKVAEGSGSSKSCERNFWGECRYKTTYTYKESYVRYQDTNRSESVEGPLWMIYDPAVAEVSEPATFALFGLGLVGLGLARKRLKA